MSTKARSKRLSYFLRQTPQEAGLSLGAGGWVAVTDLLAGLAKTGEAMTMTMTMTMAELRSIVETSDKKRFTLSEDGSQIRAAQGHSVQIENDLVPISPPEKLYHGTAIQFVDAIRTDGLRPMSRLHDHLSADTATATKVGQRHGKPIVLTVKAAELAADGTEFFQADNGVWLTASVPPNYLVFEGS